MSYNSTHTGAQIDAAIDAVETKQDRLVSGTNIKTINGQSVMGSGNLSIEATGVYECTYDVTTYADVVAAIQAGKTPIVKIGDPYEDIFTVSEWDKQGEILSFNSAYMEVEGDDFHTPDFSISVGCVLLKNIPDRTTTPSGWTTSLYQAIPRSGTIYTKEEVDAKLSAKQDILTPEQIQGIVDDATESATNSIQPSLDSLNGELDRVNDAVGSVSEELGRNLTWVQQELNTKVTTNNLQRYVDYSTEGVLNVKDGTSQNNMVINSEGISLYSGATKAIEITNSSTKLPSAEIQILKMGPYVLEYMYGDDTITLK